MTSQIATMVLAQSRTPWPDWAVTVFLIVFVLVAIFIVTMFIRRRRRK